ncbi:MAG: YbaB/EbfC family nucleoid-associated protein [Bacilli bacterium]|nr:YbaB/EbfC family nucleoid-associated protein [Bacilli bacterium]
MNMQNLMAQAQKMQRDLQKKKEEIDKTTFTGKSEMVEVIYNGKKEMVSIKILNRELTSEDLEILEDMIVLASKDAISKIDKEMEEKLGSLGSGLGGLF